VAAAAGVFVLRADARELFDGLTDRGAPLVVMSALAGLATLVLVWRERFEVARYVAALAVVSVLWGWAAAQYPWLLIDHLTIDDGAGARATLQAMLVTLGVGSAFLLPALLWLLVLARRGTLEDDHDDDQDGSAADRNAAALLRGGDAAVDRDDRAGDVGAGP
jgi:cytochrome d ubiquinol oxidase subunit II